MGILSASSPTKGHKPDQPKVQIRLRQSVASPTYEFQKGDVMDASLWDAHRMIRRGIAETVDGKPLPPLDEEDAKAVEVLHVRTVKAKGNRVIVEPATTAITREKEEKERRLAAKKGGKQLDLDDEEDEEGM